MPRIRKTRAVANQAGEAAVVRKARLVDDDYQQDGFLSRKESSGRGRRSSSTKKMSGVAGGRRARASSTSAAPKGSKKLKASSGDAAGVGGVSKMQTTSSSAADMSELEEEVEFELEDGPQQQSDTGRRRHPDSNSATDNGAMRESDLHDGQDRRKDKREDQKVHTPLSSLRRGQPTRSRRGGAAVAAVRGSSATKGIAGRGSGPGSAAVRGGRRSKAPVNYAVEDDDDNDKEVGGDC